MKKNPCAQNKKMASQVNFDAISFSAFAAAKGVKTAQAALNGAPVEFLLSDSEFYAAPFGASSFGGDIGVTRLTLELDITNSPVLAVLQAAETSIIRKAYADGIFEGMSLEEVEKQYHSCITYTEKYQSYRVRTKIQTAGFYACRFFLAPEKTKVTFDDLNLRGSTVRPHIRFKGLWRQGGQWGLQLEVINLLVQPTSEAPDPF